VFFEIPDSGQSPKTQLIPTPICVSEVTNTTGSTVALVAFAAVITVLIFKKISLMKYASMQATMLASSLVRMMKATEKKVN
jgi:hypothetical protein